MAEEKESGSPVTDTEEAADFARVGAMVGGAESVPGAPVQEPEQDAPRMDAAESLTGLLSLVGTGAEFVGLAAVAAVWVPDNCEKLASATVPVLRKYPWGARVLDFLESGTGAEEAVLLIALAGMGKATLDAYKLDTAGGEEERPAVGQVPVTPEKTATVDAPADLGGLVEVHGRAN